MNKFAIIIFAAIAGLWVYLRPDQIHSSIEAVKIWLGYPPPKPEPPPGIHFLKERIGVMMDGGIRSVAAGTEVRLVSQNDSSAIVDDGRGEFSVDISKLSRDLELRRESHLAGHAPAKGPAAPPPWSTSPDSSAASPQRRSLTSRIAGIDTQLSELMDRFRTMTTHDPVKGLVIADPEAARILQNKISTLEAEKSKLKSELAKLP